MSVIATARLRPHSLARAVSRALADWAAIPVVLIPTALILWSRSLGDVDLRAMNDLGLVSVLPPTFIVAFGVLALSFCLTLRRPRPVPLLAHVVVLVVILYSTAAITEGYPRTAIAWKLAGVTDYITQTGTVDPNIDAFFNWPGFFMLNAFVTHAAGFGNAVSFAAWAPVFFNLLYVAPLVVILRAATRDERLVWLGAWFFCLANWIGQDYLAPQALAYFLFLTIIAILLKWFVQPGREPVWRSPPWRTFQPTTSDPGGRDDVADSADGAAVPAAPWQRAMLLALVVLLFAVAVASHQLTPFATLGAVAALVVFQRVTPRGLPILMAVLAGTWLAFMADTYIRGHLAQVTGPIGSVGDNVNANVGSRFQGSAEHLLVLYTRLGFSLFVWALALLGAVRRLRNGRPVFTYALLAAAPFALPVLQTYGGELVLRVYLFSLPFMVLFAAAVFYPAATRGRSWLTTAAVAVVSTVLVAGFLVARYGNERMDYFTSDEVAAVRHLYATAAPGSRLIAATDAVPWRYRDYSTYRYVTVKPEVEAGDVNAVARRMRPGRDFLIITRAQRAAGELFEGWRPGTWERFDRALTASPSFRVVYANRDATIYVLTTHRRGAPA